MKRQMIVALGLGMVLLASLAWAEDFTVRAHIECPTFIQNGAWDTTYASTPQFGSCAGILVSAMDSDVGRDDLCGLAFTDSSGVVNFSASCGDRFDDPDIYLRVEALSALGFSVGEHDWSTWDSIASVVVGSLTGGLSLIGDAVRWLVAHKTMRWVTGEVDFDNGPDFNFGTLRVGGDTDLSRAAGRQFSAAQFTMARYIRSSNLRPMFFNYTVNHAIGAPTTVFDTVIVDGDRMLDPNRQAGELNATSHEIGHVIYNTFHSGLAHWLGDAPSYMRNHQQCNANNLRLSWYEGYASFVGDVVDNGNGSTPFRGCPAAGVDIEGNVTAFLNEIYFGFDPEPFTVLGTSMCPAGLEVVRQIGGGERCEAPPHESEFSCPDGLQITQNTVGFVCEAELPTGCEETNDPVQILTELVIDFEGGEADVCRDVVCRRDPVTGEPLCPTTPVTCMDNTTGFDAVLVERPGPDVCEVETGATLEPVANPGANAGLRPDGTPSDVLSVSDGGPRMWFGLPAFPTMIGFISSAGSGRHTPSEFFTGTTRPFCRGGTDPFGRFWYCNDVESPVFNDAIRDLGF